MKQLRETSSNQISTVTPHAPTGHGNRRFRCQESVRRSSGLRRLSVIIPALNEEDTIGHTLDSVQGGNTWEVIVVDGRSTDRTRETAIARGVTVVESPPGRARQLTVGASTATGDTFLFLHADTALPSSFDEHIDRALDKPGACAGAFRLSINAPGFSFRLVEKMVNFRSRVHQMPYGDQAIFVPADVFHQAGGFVDLPVMEDYALIRRLRRMGRIEIAPASVVTSPRRWLNHGVWRTTLRNQLSIAAYWLGQPLGRVSREPANVAEAGLSQFNAAVAENLRQP